MDLTGTAKRFHIGEGIFPIRGFRLDMVAGITLAALAIPETMGYATIAGMPVVTGLYTILLPIAVFALLGSSRHLIVGADSATAAILFAGLAGMAAVGSSQYVALAGLVALITAAILLIARLVRLGFLANFLSRTVLVGFLTGVGIQVAMGQVAGMLGVSAGTGTTLEKFWNTLKNIGDTNWWTLGISISVLVILLFWKFVTRVVPAALIAVVGWIALSYWIDVASHGVAIVGPVQSGLPSISIPDVPDWKSVFSSLTITSFSIFIVILAQSAATSRAYAAKYTEPFDENVDLVGLTGASIAAGLTGTFIVNGSPTKTQMLDDAGGKSQISSLTTAVIVGIVLLFLTGPIQYLPEAVLASVVFLIGIELVDYLGMTKIYRLRRNEFVVAAITAVLVVAWGVKQAIVLAIVFSIVDHIRLSYSPKDTVLTRSKKGHWKTLPAETAAEAAPGFVAYRFAHSLYYANADRFSDELLAIAAKADPPLKLLCIHAAAIADVDYSAGQMLLELYGQLKERGIKVVLAEVTPGVRAELDAYGFTKLVGGDAYYETIEDAYDAQGR